MINVEVDKVSLQKVEKKLGKLQSKAPEVLKKALNQTAKQARKQLSQKAQETYAVKSGRFNKSMRIKNATNGNLEAEIRSQGKPMELKDFKVSPATAATGANRPDIVKAKVVKSNGMKGLAKGNVKAFVAKFGSGHGSVAQRRGKGRLPLKVLYSNSIPKMLGSEKRVYGIVKPDINNNLKKNVNIQIKKLVG